MRSTSIIELTANDGWQNAVRKINKNFDNMYSYLTNDATSKVETKVTVVDTKITDMNMSLQRQITDAKELIGTTAESLWQSIDQILGRLDAMDSEVSSLKEAVIPPVGTLVICTYDPNKQWPGTTWTKGTATYEGQPIWKRTK